MSQAMEPYYIWTLSHCGRVGPNRRLELARRPVVLDTSLIGGAVAKSGDVIENPVFGDRIVFLKTAADTDSALLEADLFARPGAPGPPEHIHPHQEERFAVVSGTLSGRIAGREISAGSGDELVVPPGTPHTWWNAGSTEAHVRATFRPAGRLDAYLETLFRLAQDGKTNARGLPHPLQLAVLASAYFDTIYLARPPLVVQKIVFGPLAVLGRWFGYRSYYPYSRVDA